MSGETEGTGAGPSPMTGPVRASTSSMVRALVQHEGRSGEHDGDAMRLAMKLGVVVGEDDLLAEDAVGEGGEARDNCGIAFLRRNDLEQAHVNAADLKKWLHEKRRAAHEAGGDFA